MERLTYNENQLKEMSNEELLATLDDVIQMNLLKESNIEWMERYPKRVTYQKIMKELAKRL